MEKKGEQSKLASEIAHLREEKALLLVKELLDQGCDPMVLVNHCEEGMRRVGELYAQSKYSISGLIMGGEIFREAMEIISPLILAANTGRTLGKVLLGTVAGDIHDLGKNIVAILLQSIRCEIVDLGVDVPAAEFLRQARLVHPDVIGLSCLITSAYDSMRETVMLLKESGITAPIIIGGGQLSEDINRYVGADYWANDVNYGIKICERLFAGIKTPS